MCFSMCAQPKTEWFQAAATDNILALKQLSQFNSHDMADSDLTAKPPTITGFAAIHYAALTGSIIALDVLIEHEMSQKTVHNSIIEVDGLRFQLAIGSTPLMVAIAGNQQLAAQRLLKLINGRNNEGVSALIVASLLNVQFAIQHLYSEISIFDKEGNSAISYACLFGRYEFILQLQDACFQSPQTKIQFLRCVLTRNIEGKLPLDMAMQALDENRYKIQKSDKQKSMQFISGLITGLQNAVELGEIQDMGIQQKLKDIKEIYKNDDLDIEFFQEQQNVEVIEMQEDVKENQISLN